MATSKRIRGQEATVQIVVDGDVKGGSFSKVTNFNLAPRQDVTETDFLGELESDLDFQHHGYDFDFEIHEMDNKVRRLLLDLVAREKARQPQPTINVVVTFAYQAGTPASTMVIQSAKIKLDSLSIGGRKEFVSNKISGKAKTVTEI